MDPTQGVLFFDEPDNSSPEHGHATLRHWYQVYWPGLKTRTHTVLTRLQETRFPEGQNAFLAALMRMDDKELSALEHCGKDTVRQIRELITSIQRQMEQERQEGLSSEAVRNPSASPRPLFARINQFVEREKDTYRSVIQSCMYIYQDPPTHSLDEMADQLHLTRERIRQIRNASLDRISGFIRKVRAEYDKQEIPYRYLCHPVHLDVNEREGTCFNLDFVNWVLGETFESILHVGDPQKTFFRPNGHPGFIAAVPAKLGFCFNFKAFCAALAQKRSESRMEEEAVCLEEFCRPFILIPPDADMVSDIVWACTSIITLHMEEEIRDGRILFRPNQYKPIPLILEDILRQNNAPMTLEEIREVYLRSFPSKGTRDSQIRANLQRNPNVATLGRSSTYSLKEWQDGVRRGGTIRAFVMEFLDSLPQSIAPLTEIGRYVRQFRPNTKDESIYGNLLQESSGKFALFYKDGVYWFGYSDRSYGVDFDPFRAETGRRRPVKDSLEELQSFLNTHHRPPCSKAPAGEDEYRLYRFMGNMRSTYRRGIMPEDRIRDWERIEEQLSEI